MDGTGVIKESPYDRGVTFRPPLTVLVTPESDYPNTSTTTYRFVSVFYFSLRFANEATCLLPEINPFNTNGKLRYGHSQEYDSHRH